MKANIKTTQTIGVAAGYLLSAALITACFYVPPLRVPALLASIIGGAVFFYYQFRRRTSKHSVELNRLAAELRESEQRFRVTFDHAAGMGLTTTKGEWVRVNKSLCDLVGYSESDLLKTPLRSLSHPEDLEWLQEQLTNLLRGSIASVELEQRLLRRDREVICVALSATKIAEANKKSARLLVQVQDITDRKRVEERLIHEALHDDLTGLPNRALYMDHLRKAVARWKRRDHGAFAVLFLDLDGFKGINDTLGHLAGDQLLVEFTQRLTANVRPGDTFARLGGDEFSILLDDLNDLNDAIIAVKRLQRMLQEPFHLSGRELFVTSSIGVALSTPEYVDPDEILRHADAAMYRAKKLGKGRYEVFDQTTSKRLERQSQIETDLSRAVERAELFLEYQPIVALETGRIAGFEALLRWQHPTLGMISPPDFITVAEATGAIVPIGEWVLEEGCRQTREWQKTCPQSPPLYVSINLSVKQFTQPDLVEQVAIALHNGGLDPSSLRLEITETMLMNAESAIRMLSELNALGVGISIDDFGTGYSSLSYLHRLPISNLKVDRSFVNSMSGNRESFEIVRTIITLAQSLHLTIVAEGIETNEQLEMLRELNCEYGQGHFFSKALTVEWAASLLFANANIAFDTRTPRRPAPPPVSLLAH
ncbi:MAG TPA: EAL domain-containing protein [Pyrinomonadaceae bacterium]|nr:EAL domain-containing protein [Pyrinomonadaceae bacterium]